MNPNRLVFLAEADSTIAMTREYARAPRGERAHDSILRNRDTVPTMLGAMTLDDITMMLTIEGDTCKEVFLAFVERVQLQTLESSDFMVLDNHGAHRSRLALDAIHNAGATPVFLPPYSPELNPIELAWFKLKGFLRD